MAKDPWQFACDWYNAEQIHKSLQMQRIEGHYNPVPNDVSGMRFAEWLTHQYRLAMHKGIEIGKRMEKGESVD